MSRLTNYISRVTLT